MRAHRGPGIRPRRVGHSVAVLAVTCVVVAFAQAGCSGPTNGAGSAAGQATAHAATCQPVRAVSVRPDTEFGNLFRSYGDQNVLGLRWTGSDGTWSVRLPDGQTLWNMGDTFMGAVHPPDAFHLTWWRDPPAATGSDSWFIRNSGLLQQSPFQGGRLTTTLYRFSPDGVPTSWVAEPGRHLRYGPGAAVVEPAAPGSRTKVLRLFDVVISDADTPRYPFGFDAASVVVTFGLSHLSRPVSIVTLPKGPGPDPAHQVFFGFAAVTSGAFTYVFGGTGNAPLEASAYLARYRTGAAADQSAWQYWDGASWSPDIQLAQPVLPYSANSGGASPGYSVARWGSTWVLFTVADEHGEDIGPIVSYWACAPTGPWHGPYRVYQPPQTVAGGSSGNMLEYNPHVHPEWTNGSGLLLSYDINDFLLSAVASVIEANVNLYRPQFIRIKLGPVRARK